MDENKSIVTIDNNGIGTYQRDYFEQNLPGSLKLSTFTDVDNYREKVMAKAAHIAMDHHEKEGGEVMIPKVYLGGSTVGDAHVSSDSKLVVSFTTAHGSLMEDVIARSETLWAMHNASQQQIENDDGDED